MYKTFRVLSLVSESRDSYGLQLQDYRKYRHYCSRKGASLRKALGVQSRNAKRQLITIDQVNQDNRFLEIVLLDAERCWAFAMDLKQGAENSNGDRRVIRKLQKAVFHVKHLKKLVELCLPDDISIIELSSYLLDISGQHKLAKECLEDALREFSNCWKILAVLDRLDPSENVKRMITLVEPNIRYCAYVLGIASSDITRLAEYFKIEDDVVCRIEKIDPLVLSPLEENARVTEIIWRGKMVKVDNIDVGMNLAKVQKAQHDVDQCQVAENKVRVQSYDGLLLALSEAQDTVQRAVQEEEKSLASEEKMQQLQILLTYITFHAIWKRIERDLLLVDDILLGSLTTVTRRNIVKLYGTIISSIEQCNALGGVARDDTLVRMLDGQASYYKHLRCAAIAGSFDKCGTRHQALALFEKSKKYLEQSQRSLSGIVQDPSLMKHSLDLKSAKTGISIEIARMQAFVVLEEKKEETIKTPLYNSLSRFQKPGDNLVHVQENIEPIPLKPIFFDIGLNFIHYDTDGKESRGLFGLWGR